MAIYEGADVDDHLFTHFMPAFHRGRTQMGQQQNIVRGQQARINCRLMLEDIETGTGDFSRFYQVGKRALVDHLTT